MAYHEAGHAVIAYLEDLPLLEASIQPDAVSLGRVRHRRWRVPPDPVDRYRARRKLEPRILCAYAGVIAERREAGRYDWKSARLDLAWADLAESHCLVFASAEADAYHRWMWKRTEALVGFYWPAIIGVAEALLEQGTVPPQALRDLLRAHLGLSPGEILQQAHRR